SGFDRLSVVNHQSLFIKEKAKDAEPDYRVEHPGLNLKAVDNLGAKLTAQDAKRPTKVQHIKQRGDNNQRARHESEPAQKKQAKIGDSKQYESGDERCSFTERNSIGPRIGFLIELEIADFVVAMAG